MEHLVRILKDLNLQGYMDGEGHEYQYTGYSTGHHHFTRDVAMEDTLAIKTSNLFNSNDSNVRIDIDINLSHSRDNPLDDILDIAKASEMYQEMIDTYEGFIGQPSTICLPSLMGEALIKDLYHQRDTTTMALVCGIHPLLDKLEEWANEIKEECINNIGQCPTYYATAERIVWMMETCETLIHSYRDQIQDTLDNLQYLRNIIDARLHWFNDEYEDIVFDKSDMSSIIRIQEVKNLLDVISDKLQERSDMYSELEDLQTEYESLDSKVSDLID
tara:strand:- start:1470 stop:2291 length:822 start_codon:yes stop_codon:yes gene_type:complete